MKTCLVFILSFAFLDLAAQIKNIPPDLLDSLLTKGRVYYLQDDGKTYYGCGYTLDELHIKVLFTSCAINQSSRKIHVKGYIYDDIRKEGEKSDTIGGGEVFIAKPVGEKLRKKKPLNSFIDPFTGRFEIIFIYEMDYNLYFNRSAPYCMHELRLNKLFGQ